MFTRSNRGAFNPLKQDYESIVAMGPKRRICCLTECRNGMHIGAQETHRREKLWPVPGGKAVGVRLAKSKGRSQDRHEVIRASGAVISNASVWDTQKLLPCGAAPQKWRQESLATPMTGSFMHLHLGFDAEGLTDLQMHHIVVNSWVSCKFPTTCPPLWMLHIGQLLDIFRSRW